MHDRGARHRGVDERRKTEVTVAYRGYQGVDVGSPNFTMKRFRMTCRTAPAQGENPLKERVSLSLSGQRAGKRVQRGNCGGLHA